MLQCLLRVVRMNFNVKQINVFILRGNAMVKLNVKMVLMKKTVLVVNLININALINNVWQGKNYVKITLVQVLPALVVRRNIFCFFLLQCNDMRDEIC